MAVVVRKKILIDGSEVELKTYQPPGRLLKEERERADRLDEILKTKIPAFAAEVLRSEPRSNAVRRWYVLGQKLRTIVDDRGLVSSSDTNSGLVWQAIWHFLPESLRPAQSDATEDYSSKQHKRKDHLSLCYEISAWQWDEVSWIQRWDDWHQLAFRPGLLRDRRIIRTLGRALSRSQSYPTRETFREAVKRLGEAFPTRRHRDSSLLPDDAIDKAITSALLGLTIDKNQGRSFN